MGLGTSANHSRSKSVYLPPKMKGMSPRPSVGKPWMWPNTMMRMSSMLNSDATKHLVLVDTCVPVMVHFFSNLARYDATYSIVSCHVRWARMPCELGPVCYYADPRIGNSRHGETHAD